MAEQIEYLTTWEEQRGRREMWGAEKGTRRRAAGITEIIPDAWRWGE